MALKVDSGSFLYDATVSGSALAISPVPAISRSYARIYGISGFILNYNAQRLTFNTAWDGFAFSLSFGSSSSLVQYLTFEYLFFSGSLCSNCPGYPLEANGTCVNFCPIGSSNSAMNICIFCGEGRNWNGSVCILSCSSGQFLNTTTNECQCPPSLNWNGQICVSCNSNGKVWVESSQSCECPIPFRWNGYGCANIAPCTGGQIWDVYSYSCQCASYQYLNNGVCTNIPVCIGGQVLSNYQCVCQNNYVWNGATCNYTPCIGGQVWTGSNCVCSAGLHFNGTMCLECINGQIWNASTLNCVCDSGFKWNGQLCENTYQCSGNRVWNATYAQCICPSNYYWSGYSCLPVPTCTGGQYWDQGLQSCVCLTGYKFNGTSCVLCNGGQIWNQTTLTCSCPVGTIQNGNTGQCNIQQQCTGSRIWMQNLWSCECPASTVWNGNFCIVNPCDSGRVWNANFKSCQCPDSKVWNNSACVPPQIACTNGQVWSPAIYACACPRGTWATTASCDAIPTCQETYVYNPLNNKCNCAFGLVVKNGICADPACPIGQSWNGYKCTIISCPPPSFFSVNRCVYNGPATTSSACTFGYAWSGKECVFSPPQCPSGSSWTNNACVSTQCGLGYFLNNEGKCQILPQQCPPGTTFQGTKCASATGNCPTGTYASSGKCLPTVPCASGTVWDAVYLQCSCPTGQIFTGKSCLACPNQKVWTLANGCACPDGTFDTGAACQQTTQTTCSVIPNAYWNNNMCMCRPGFTKVDFQCVCYGTANGNQCDLCSYKPNSSYVPVTNLCQCNSGFTEIAGFCVPQGSQIGTDSPDRCSVGTYFDTNHRMCLACPSGCLSCASCYSCITCRPQFTYNTQSSTCQEKCGDGMKFVLPCDDGNNNDGDGCSRDCHVEPGYTCAGGSATSLDNCFNTLPTSVNIIQTGVVRLGTSIVLNLRINYIPKSLLLGTECQNNCKQLLVGTITSGDTGSLAITSSYLAGTSYDFTMTIGFGRSYIGQFSIDVKFSPNAVRYFGAISIAAATFTVNPAYLASVESSRDTLS